MRECRDSTGADVLFGPRVLVVNEQVRYQYDRMRVRNSPSYRVEVRSLSRKNHVVAPTRNSDRVRINGRRSSPFVFRIRRDRFSSNLNFLAGLKVEISGELKERQGARLFSGDIVAKVLFTFFQKVYISLRQPKTEVLSIVCTKSSEFFFECLLRELRSPVRDIRLVLAKCLEENDIMLSIYLENNTIGQNGAIALGEMFSNKFKLSKLNVEQLSNHLHYEFGLHLIKYEFVSLHKVKSHGVQKFLVIARLMILTENINQFLGMSLSYRYSLLIRLTC